MHSLYNSYYCMPSQSSRIVKQPETNGYMSTFVQIHDDTNGWGYLCFESIDINMASVICRETTQTFAFRMRKASHPDFTHIRYTSSLNCTGEESSLRECKRNLVATRKCKDEETILECRPGNINFSCPKNDIYRMVYIYVHKSQLYSSNAH